MPPRPSAMLVPVAGHPSGERPGRHAGMGEATCDVPLVQPPLAWPCAASALASLAFPVPAAGQPHVVVQPVALAALARSAPAWQSFLFFSTVVLGEMGGDAQLALAYRPLAALAGPRGRLPRLVCSRLCSDVVHQWPQRSWLQRGVPWQTVCRREPLVVGGVTATLCCVAVCRRRLRHC